MIVLFHPPKVSSTDEVPCTFPLYLWGNGSVHCIVGQTGFLLVCGINMQLGTMGIVDRHSSFEMSVVVEG